MPGLRPTRFSAASIAALISPELMLVCPMARRPRFFLRRRLARRLRLRRRLCFLCLPARRRRFRRRLRLPILGRLLRCASVDMLRLVPPPPPCERVTPIAREHR